MTYLSRNRAREEMVDQQIVSRGVRSTKVLEAMRKVPRERFLPERLREFAYEDTPLPIAANQTISQPYIVAFMVEALDLKGGESVLEIGTGSGYAAAVLAEIAAGVYTVERIEELAASSESTLRSLGYDHVHVRCADGTLGWPEHAPYDAIVVAAGGPEVPESLKQQLRVGGRLVIPVGHTPESQELVRVTRLSDTEFKEEDIADVRFVPLVGAEGWTDTTGGRTRTSRSSVETHNAALLVEENCQPFDSIDTLDLEPMVRRIGNARVVLLGESSHGTSEFYRLRARITHALIERHGFDFVAIEGDWPDAARIDHYVRHAEYPPSEWTAFARFPTWMWRNEEVRTFVDWLRAHNSERAASNRVAFRGLDLYSMYNSIRGVLEYLDEVDPHAAKVARQRYGCLTPWQSDPASYGQAALSGRYTKCEDGVVAMLMDIMGKRQAYAEHDGERFLNAEQNARLVANAERYYRMMYYGSRASWNLRDSYMFDTLQTLLDFHGPESKVIVWAHNSHVGDSAFTEMATRGEHNIGNLCKRAYGDLAYAIGFGTHTGQVAAATDWDGPMQVKNVVPSLPDSYERLCHDTGIANFLLPLRSSPSSDLVKVLTKPRLERAIGVIYRPETERESHYFHAVLPRQFDEYVWLNTTTAVTPFDTSVAAGLPDTYPFGL